jgi:CubicO group peptidase (beta-lactamase class C family)
MRKMENVSQYLIRNSCRSFPLLIVVGVLIFSVPTRAGQESGNASIPFERFDEFKMYLQKKMESTKTPSISIAIAQDGKILYEESFGWANREQKIEATPHTIYSIASVSKPMTATAMMILVERGLVDLNKPVNFYLGETKLTACEGDVSDATIARLLQHTAGLPTIWDFYFDGAKIKRPSISESIEKYAILTSPPGTVYEYSNLGYGIAEYVIERVTGSSFKHFMQSEVFEPLDMHRSFVITNKAEYDSTAARYLENKNRSPFYETMSRGGGGICASVHDLLCFGMFHLKDHLPAQKAIISDSTIDYMRSRVDPAVPDSPYKLGWDVREIRGYRVVSHGGGMPGVSSALMLVPAENVAIAILCNGTYIDLDEIGHVILALMLPSKEEKQKPDIEKEMVDELADQFPSLKFVGHWKGEIRTDEGPIPVNLQIDEAGRVMLTLVNEARLCEPIEPFCYEYGTLRGSFDFNIPTKDASVCRHKVYLSLKLNDNRLSGYAAAVSYRMEVFHLPYYMTLEKQIHLH